MPIDSQELIKSLERMKQDQKDIVSSVFNRGIQTAIEVVKIHEGKYIAGLALEKGEK